MKPGPKPSVSYWASKRAYGCWLGSSQQILSRGPDDAPSGPTYIAALHQFRKLVSLEAGIGTDDYLVSALFNQDRAHLDATRKSAAPGVFEVMSGNELIAGIRYHSHSFFLRASRFMMAGWVAFEQTCRFSPSKAENMRFSIPNVTGELVLTKEECGYQEVVDSFATATSITVVTYNISENQDKLLDSLRGLDAELRIISAIPSRMKYYANSSKGEYFRKRAKPGIQLYLSKLAPEEFGPLTNVSFCFSNHAKIIMTEKIGYVGSGNFSDESGNNWESGIIVRDEQMLRQLYSFADEIEKDSVRYYGVDMIKKLVPLLDARANLLKVKERIAEDFAQVEAQEVKDAVNTLRAAITTTDGAWSEDNYESGPIYSRIDDWDLSQIESWHEESGAVYEVEEAMQRLRDAEDGNIPVDNLMVNGDGIVLDSEFDGVVEDREMELEECLIKAQVASRDLQSKIEAVGQEVDEICREINRHIKKIDNT